MTATVDRPMDGFDGILEAARSGQEWAVACLYEELQPAIFRYLRWQEPSMAEDLAGETWLAVAERLAAFEGDEGAFRGWIFAIARRRLADHRRRAARRQTAPVPEEVLVGVADPGDPSELVIDKLSAQQALSLLTDALPPDQAEVIVLRVIGGLSVQETARVMSKRPGFVRVLQHRALRRLANAEALKSALEV
ncbi:MAG: RNA polymerase sigma factor [Acidimicrobiales bacterium]